jgi:hypothetical protein
MPQPEGNAPADSAESSRAILAEMAVKQRQFCRVGHVLVQTHAMGGSPASPCAPRSAPAVGPRVSPARAKRTPNQVRLVLLQLIFHFVDAGIDAGLVDAGRAREANSANYIIADLDRHAAADNETAPVT